MYIGIYFFIFLFVILVLLNLVFHISYLYSEKGFPSKNQFLFSCLIFVLYSVLLILLISIILIKKFPTSYFSIFILYHLTIFFFVYAINIFTIWFLKRLNKILNKFFKKLTKIKNCLEHHKNMFSKILHLLLSILLPKSDFYLIPLEYNFTQTIIWENTILLRRILLVSYFSSILIFIFIFKNYIISLSINDPSINMELLKEDFKLYYNVFFLSSITVLIAFKNKKN